jgi:hypothetical protein
MPLAINIPKSKARFVFEIITAHRLRPNSQAEFGSVSMRFKEATNGERVAGR